MGSELLQNLLDDAEARPFTVTEINAKVRAELERRFGSVWIEGEVTNFVAHGSGHWYFSLRDEKAVLRAACFRNSNQRIRFRPGNGMLVRVRGRLTVYEPSGSYQIVVDSLEPSGEGALRAAKEQIEQRLRAEGLFDESLKRALPYLPHRVGVVTSASGAAFHDIRKVLTTRTSTVSILLIPAMVQGENAGADLTRAIEFANEFSAGAPPEERLDVLIVGRGGGSQEDLWAFNEEGLARAIRASAIPVISAVGHEIDHTIADLVADVRAATPSMAAEMVAASEEAVRGRIAGSSRLIGQVMEAKLLRAKSRLREASGSHALVGFPSKVVELQREVGGLAEELKRLASARLGDAARRLADAVRRMSPQKLAFDVRQKRTGFEALNRRQAVAMGRALDIKRERMRVAAASLDALSPLRVLGRGYSIARAADGSLLRSSEQVRVGDEIEVTLAEGALRATVGACGESKGNR